MVSLARLPDATPLKHRACFVASASPRSTSASASTASASGRCGSGLRDAWIAGRACSSPATSRTDSCVVSNAFGHALQSPGRLSASPSPFDAKRLLLRELGAAQIFSMAGDSPNKDDSATPSPSKKAVKNMCVTTDLPPLASEELDTPSTFLSEIGDLGLLGELDAWVEEDWVSPTRATTSPCTAARELTKRQREVADAVVSELQIDLEAQMQRAVNDITSWISEEIAFARQGFEEDAQRSYASWATERSDMQDDHRMLSMRLDKLQATLDEQTLERMMHTGDYDMVVKVEQLQATVDEQALAIQTLGQCATQDALCNPTCEDIEAFCGRLNEHEAQLISLQIKLEAQAFEEWHCSQTSVDVEMLCSRVNEHESQLIALPSKFQAQILSTEHGLVAAMAELCSDSQRTQAELTDRHFGKMHQILTDMQTDVDQTHLAHQGAVEELAFSLEHVVASNLEQGEITQMHEEWMKEVGTWLEKETGGWSSSFGWPKLLGSTSPLWPLPEPVN